MNIYYKKSFFLLFICSFSFAESPKDYLNLLSKVDFDAAMVTEQNYSNRKEFWTRNKEPFNKYIVKNPQYIDTPRIPKIIHQIWLGSPFPDRCKYFRSTWIKHHPDWKFMFWTEKEIDAFGLRNRAIYDAATNYGEKSDIARYEILERFGGLYIDTDFECLKPFDVFHHICDFYVGLGYFMSGGLYNGLIGCTPGHPIMKKCVQNTHRPANATNDSMEIIMRSGPGNIGPSFYSLIETCPGINIAFPFSFFYPWPNYVRQDNSPARIASYVRPETFAIHHWHSSWNK